MTEKQIMTDVLIVGAGTAGLTAAVYAARAGKSVKLVEQYLQGRADHQCFACREFPRL